MPKKKAQSGSPKVTSVATVKPSAAGYNYKVSTGAFVLHEVSKAARSYFAPVRGIVSAVRKETKTT